MLPYLDLSSNQHYLVQRVRDLAKDGCIYEFKWNSGGNEKIGSLTEVKRLSLNQITDSAPCMGYMYTSHFSMVKIWFLLTEK